MKHENIAYLITDPVNQRYFHRQTFFAGAVYQAGERAVFLSWGNTTQELLPEGISLLPVAENEFPAGLSRLLSEDHITRLYVEQDIPLDLYQRLAHGLPVPLIAQSGYAEGLREIKSDWELRQIQKACDITDAAFSWILDKIRPGVSELGIAAALEYKMRLLGAGESNRTIVAAGVGSASPHHWPTEVLIREGDFVTMDYGCTVNGYHSDLTRTVVVGKASEAQKRIYNTVLEAQLKSLDRLREGATGGEIDQIAREIIDRSDYSGSFLHNLGHGIGLDIHEGTGLVQSSGSVLRAGMVVSVEPGIYLPGTGGVRIEDIALVRKTDAIPLEHSDKRLIEL